MSWTRTTTVRVVAPAVVLTGVLGAALVTDLALAPSTTTTTAERDGRVASGPGLTEIRAAAPGVLRVDYRFDRQGRPASNQYAIWIETADGEYVATVFATSWIAHGGYTRRPMSMPNWRASADWEEATPGQVEAAARPVPTSGAQTVYWDGLDADGRVAPPGDYVLRVEGNVFWEQMVAFEAPFTIGAAAQQTAAQQTRNDLPGDVMLSQVSVDYLAGRPFSQDMSTAYTRGS